MHVHMCFVCMCVFVYSCVCMNVCIKVLCIYVQIFDSYPCHTLHTHPDLLICTAVSNSSTPRCIDNMNNSAHRCYAIQDHTPILLIPHMLF